MLFCRLGNNNQTYSRRRDGGFGDGGIGEGEIGDWNGMNGLPTL
jgi:hypothetical protein